MHNLARKLKLESLNFFTDALKLSSEDEKSREDEISRETETICREYLRKKKI
jgi:hypothetical protein